MPVKPLPIVLMLRSAFGLLPALAGLAARAQDCPGPAADAALVRLAGADADGDPLLTDGRRLRLVGLAPRQNATEAQRFAAALQARRERDWRLVPLGPTDRWGRLPARLLAADGPDAAGADDLAALLLKDGAASRLPDPAHAACDAVLRALETGGAAQAQPVAAGAFDGHDLAALKAQAGRLVVLEGRIASVGERAQRTYLNFSRRRGEAASIVMSRKLWRELQDAGWTTATLAGKRVRARGVLSGGDSLLLDLTARISLDVID